ncbi:efflux RND transporter permease subunit [Sediminibacterium sp.]|uniref:efflux RND transporter permease subunit n=1 Tax=Sediminibacterium sp. TaxID=1917865 RepID=UPI003F6F8B63
MWYKAGKTILRFRISLLFLLFVATAFMAWQASKVQLSYDFTRALPTDNPKFIAYQDFLKQFGNDGNTVVIGIQANRFYEKDFFNEVYALSQRLKKVPGVNEVLSVPDAVTLLNDAEKQQLVPQKIFNPPYANQADLDSAKSTFENLPFYRTLLYNPEKKAYLLGVTVNKDSINSKYRTVIVNNILKETGIFESNTKSTLQISGLPFIRTVIGDRIKDEMNWFLIGSLVLSAITLFIFFRSVSATIMSLLVVGMGVIWSVGTLVLFGYKITLLTALIPPLVVVIGIPNCIYFLNKYHTAYKEKGNKEEALVTMVGRMGIVTLFCNIAAAIGFAVFALTKSQLLKEFGAVAGINILLLFFISLFFIPPVLSFLPAPKTKHTKYLDNAFLASILVKIERWTFHHTRMVYMVTIIVTVISIIGIFRIKSEGFIVDDLPKADKIYTDLKWFEDNFGGVMPLEIIVDTKKKNGLMRSVKPIAAIDEFSAYLDSSEYTARPLSFVEGLKFAKQAFYDGDSLSYAIPYESDLAFIGPYLKAKKDSSSKSDGSGAFNRLINNFIDSNKQKARISVNMKDVGSAKLPELLAAFEARANQVFDTATYKVSFTGSSVSFLEGSSFIINGLKESIFWAFLLITLCMLYLFKSMRILVSSLIPNLIPLIVTAGVMGWAGIALKPSTVLVFSVALGIVIDVTIRFLINYKQELPAHNNQVNPTLIHTIRHTGISIIYTSLVLIAGFVIFSFSDFGGTKALGWLTSLTLVVGTITNLVLLPVLILTISGNKKG